MLRSNRHNLGTSGVNMLKSDLVEREVKEEFSKNENIPKNIFKIPKKENPLKKKSKFQKS